MDKDPMLTAAVALSDALGAWKHGAITDTGLMRAIQNLVYATLERHDEIKAACEPSSSFP